MTNYSRTRASFLDVFSLLVVLTLAQNSRADDAVSKAKPFTNSLGMKFVPVPGTKVLMCIHETRRADYAAYAATDSTAHPSWKKVAIENIPVGAGDDEPVVNVSWDDAKAFCEWLGKKEGHSYRLPLDREWSVAVGIGSREPAAGATPESLNAKLTDVYPWGRQWPPAKGAGNYADDDCRKKIKSEKTMEGYADGFAATAPVMSFSPNELGIYDLAGNVWEWCEDWFNTEKKLHVLRGASWGSSARKPLLSSFRATQTADRRWRCNGFRCVLVVEAEKNADEPKHTVRIDDSWARGDRRWQSGDVRTNRVVTAEPFSWPLDLPAASPLLKMRFRITEERCRIGRVVGHSAGSTGMVRSLGR